MANPRWVTAEEAIAAIKPGSTILIGESCGEPQTLVEALVADKERLKGSRLIECRRIVGAKYAPLTDYFHMVSIHLTPDLRDAVQARKADFLPVKLSEAHNLFREGGPVPLDVALVQVSPPDSRNYCSFSTGVGYSMEAARCARMIIAEVNKRMPRTFGDCNWHIDNFDYLVETSRPVLENPVRDIAEDELAVAKNVAQLIDDGSTLSIGIGGISEAVVSSLGNKRNLGIHSGIITDSIIEPTRKGIINNLMKTIDRGKTVAALALGTEKLFEFIHENPGIEMHPFSYTHDIRRLAQIDRFIAINAAVEVDLTGQVNAESVGSTQISTVGGQADLGRGALLSSGGKSIIALASATRGGKSSKIVPLLKEGSIVSTPRYDVQYIVTEYGVAELWGKTINQRMDALIAIAHPRFRDELKRAAKGL